MPLHSQLDNVLSLVKEETFTSSFGISTSVLTSEPD